MSSLGLKLQFYHNKFDPFGQHRFNHNLQAIWKIIRVLWAWGTLYILISNNEEWRWGAKFYVPVIMKHVGFLINQMGSGSKYSSDFNFSWQL